MNKFFALVMVVVAGVAVVATAYVLSKSKLGGKAKASSEKISVLGRLEKQQPCLNENFCYQLLAKTDGQKYLINTKEFAWISISADELEKYVGKVIEVEGLYIQGKTSYIVPTGIK